MVGWHHRLDICETRRGQGGDVATGIVASAANRTALLTTITQRFSLASMSDPNGTEMTALETAPIAASADTSKAPACRTRIAMSGSAPAPTPLPTALTAYACQKRRNATGRMGFSFGGDIARH